MSTTIIVAALTKPLVRNALSRDRRNRCAMEELSLSHRSTAYTIAMNVERDDSSGYLSLATVGARFPGVRRTTFREKGTRQEVSVMTQGGYCDTVVDDWLRASFATPA